MLIVHVHVHVKPESVAEFRQATVENARASVQEPGIARFDVIRAAGRCNPVCADRGLPHARSGGRAQRDRSLREVARYGCANDGRAAPQREVQRRVPRAAGLVASMRFEFATATRIVFGEGTAATLPELVRTFGTRPLVVTGAGRERAAAVVAALSAEVFAVPGEPTVELVREGARHVKDAGCDVVIAIGGGSAIDAGKAIAAVATNGGEPLEFLEVVGKGRAIADAPLPFIAAPTTAGTGSEVTRNAVLGSTEHGVKASMRSPLMLPQVAVVDPELTYGLPPARITTAGNRSAAAAISPPSMPRWPPSTPAPTATTATQPARRKISKPAT